jgi:hypothetical protein
MKVEFALLADAVAWTVDGKLSMVNGGIEDYSASIWPAVAPMIYLVVRLRYDALDEMGAHTYRIELWNEDGAKMGSWGTNPYTPTPIAYDPTRYNSNTIAVPFPMLTFPKPGRYGFYVFEGDEEVVSVPLYMREVSA